MDCDGSLVHKIFSNIRLILKIYTVIALIVGRGKVTSGICFHSDTPAGLVPVPVALAHIPTDRLFNAILYFRCYRFGIYADRRTLFRVIDSATADCRN